MKNKIQLNRKGTSIEQFVFVSSLIHDKVKFVECTHVRKIHIILINTRENLCYNNLQTRIKLQINKIVVCAVSTYNENSG